MQRRSCLIALFATLPGRVPAQPKPGPKASATPSARDFIDRLWQGWYRPRAVEFDAAAAALSAAAGRRAAAEDRSREAVRQAWRSALLAWARLTAVPFGPPIERRSLRQIDFQPTRPPHILRAIAQGVASVEALDRVGRAAQGFAALEWLLWSADAPDSAQARAYAAALAQEVANEAAALRKAFAAPLVVAGADGQAALSDLVNQWVGAVEKLRLQGLLRPVQEATVRGWARPLLRRSLSDADAAERAARWQSLQAIGVGAAPAGAGSGGGVLPIEAYLRAKGSAAQADRMRAAASATGAAIAASAADDPAALAAAARALALLNQQVVAEVAPALDVHISFTDADGD